MDIQESVDELKALGDSPEHVLTRLPSEDWHSDQADPGRWDAARQLAELQADDLERVAGLLRSTGVPVGDVIFRPRIKTYWFGLDPNMQRDVSQAGARFVASARSVLDPVASSKPQAEPNSSYWGLKLRLQSGFEFNHVVSNESTCDYVPVLDDVGEPVLEEQRVAEPATYTTEMVPVTERRCVPLFS